MTLEKLNGRYERIENAVPRVPEGYPDFSGLSGEELYYASLRARLAKALRHSDQADAAKYRRYLAEDKEQLIADFLSIDEMSVPTFEYAPVAHTQYCAIRMHRTQFRADLASVQRSLADNRLGTGDFETMHLWLESR